MLSSGEGAVSTGAMVPVFAAQDSGSATRVVALLEAHAIPAIVDSDLSVATGWARAGQRPRVLVPSTMLPAARAILHAHTEPSEAPALATWVPAKVDSAPMPTPSAAVPAALDAAPADEDDERPATEVLPDPGPTAPRITLALAFIAFGLVLQRGLELLLSERATVRAFGASYDVLEAPWRLVTAGFMHGSVSHMVSNALFGLLIGVVLFGSHRIGATMLVWLVASVTGIAAELSMSPDGRIVVIGASAGNYGLVGLWAFGQLQRARRAPLPSRERVKTLGVLLLLVPGAFTPFSSSGTRIAVFAHGIGFVAGFLLGGIYARRLETRTPELDRRARLAGAVAISLSIGALSAALVDAFA